MVFNTYTNGDPRSFFYYNGDYYINGTEIILSDEYISRQRSNGIKLWKYAKYHHQVECNNKISYFFCRSRCDWIVLYNMGLEQKDVDECRPYFLIDAVDIEIAIKEFVRPIKLCKDDTNAILGYISRPKREFDDTRVVLLWIAYLFAMFCSLIFKKFYILWVAISILFFKLRKEMLKK